ncbi:MAG: phenylalanine--tRNA ligase subunit alpha [Bacteroidota bacterium]|jgi:phenylalanyl-tRNA synthetase alpha chain
MQEKINQIIDEINSFKANDFKDAEEFRLKFLSKNGKVSLLFDEFKEVSPEDKRALGKPINELKNIAQNKFNDLQEQFTKSTEKGSSSIDYTLPGDAYQTGSRHPLSLVRNQIIEIFNKIGFSVADGPEIEDDWHNFSALNFPEEHPARDMQDTFFVDENWALRTHTSSIQIRVMEKQKPPMRLLAPGRVYRNEAISARAHCQFHQVEGFYIDKNVSFADLKQTLLYFAKEMFGTQTKIRLRPSFFPFTEPSAEMDISCMFCNQNGCNICKHSGWVEILGCGMIDPNVLINCNINPDEYSGFAFGMGIERITMLKYKINDLRLFFENDVQFLKQFSKII